MAAIVANCAISLNCELTQPVKVQYIDGNMFSMDNAGNTAHVYVFYNGEPQEIVGSVSADVIRSDGTTVAITGAMSGNRAYVIFPQSCYAVPGVVSVVIKVTEGTTVTTIAAFVANVYRSSTDTIVDPGTIIPSVQNLISAIETAVASIPADYSSLWESLAPDYTDITFPVTAGKYCTYNGTLYIAKVDIATTESFTAAHWQSTNIGDNLSALKSAIDANYHSYNSSRYSWTLKRNIDNSGNVSTANGFALSNNIKINGATIIYNTTGDTGVNGKTTAFHVNQFTKAGVFISRTILAAGESLRLGTTTGYIRIAYGYPSAQSVTITRALVDTYFSVGIVAECATEKEIRQISAQGFAELGKGLYEEQYNKSTISTSWSAYEIDQSSGGLVSSTKYICSNFIPVYNSLPIEINAPDNMECIVVKYSSNASVSSFTGINFDYMPGSQRQAVDSAYIRICVRYSDGSDISTSDASNITLARYANQEADNVSFAINALNETLEKQTKSTSWEQGNISVVIDPETGQGTASPVSSNKHIRSNYISLKAGSSLRINFPENEVSITVYEYDAQSAVGYTDTLTSDNTSGYFVYNEPDYANIRIVAKYVSDDNILPAAGADITITLYSTKKEFNILVLGNSFSQDSFAYLPPVLNEALPEYVVNYGVAYTSSTSIQDHINYYNNETKYTSYREWSYKAGAWKLYTSSGDYDRGKTLADIMALRNWDIIYVQPASRVAGDDTHTAAWYVQNRIIYPGRKLLEILKSLSNKPFAYLMGEWLATDSDGDHGVEVFGLLADALELTENSLGIDGVIPIGAAFQNARSNTTLQALGDATIHNMLCTDGQHMQSGIPALLATYTIANYILRLMGMKRSIHGSSFVPTDANCIAIKAWKANDANPKMTHGSSVGVADESITANMNAAQEIAIMAVRKPYEITDCADIFTNTYTPES